MTSFVLTEFQHTFAAYWNFVLEIFIQHTLLMYCNCLISYLCKIIKWTELQTEPCCSPLETSFKVDMGPLINAFCIPSFNQQWCLRNESFQKPTNVNVRDVEVRRLIISSSHRRKLLEEQCFLQHQKREILKQWPKMPIFPLKEEVVPEILCSIVHIIISTNHFSSEKRTQREISKKCSSDRKDKGSKCPRWKRLGQKPWVGCPGAGHRIGTNLSCLHPVR